MAGTAHLVCFRIGKETFGVDIFAVREIVKAQEITPVPGANDHVLGIINLRGKIISVMDLSARLGLGATRVARASRILVADLDGMTVGFLVDAATEVLKLPDTSIDPAPEELKSTIRDDYLDGVGKLEDRLVIVLNLHNLISTEDTEALETALAVSRNEAS